MSQQAVAIPVSYGNLLLSPDAAIAQQVADREHKKTSSRKSREGSKRSSRQSSRHGSRTASPVAARDAGPRITIQQQSNGVSSNSPSTIWTHHAMLGSEFLRPPSYFRPTSITSITSQQRSQPAQQQQQQSSSQTSSPASRQQQSQQQSQSLSPANSANHHQRQGSSTTSSPANNKLTRAEIDALQAAQASHRAKIYHNVNTGELGQSKALKRQQEIAAQQAKPILSNSGSQQSAAEIDAAYQVSKPRFVTSNRPANEEDILVALDGPKALKRLYKQREKELLKQESGDLRMSLARHEDVVVVVVATS
jgi:hypothetical protein